MLWSFLKHYWRFHFLIKISKKVEENPKKRFLDRPWSEEAAFANCDACVELVLEFPEAMEHQQFKDREMIVDVLTHLDQPRDR